MRNRRSSRPFQTGFSVTELLVVVATVMVLTVVALPNVVVTIANSRIRASMTSLSGLLQNTRTVAVKRNRTMTTRMQLEPHGIIAYAKEATDDPNLLPTDTQVQLQSPVSRMTVLTGFGAPEPLDSGILGFIPSSSFPSFNPRGLPCLYNAGTCAPSGFRYYFKDSRSVGASGWSALSISPAGRIKKWYWSGSEWVD